MSSRDHTSSMRMANSSPPRRAAVSSGRRQSERSLATRLSSWSPTPCPRLSFTVLKSSRSMKSTARWEPVWPIRARACSSRSWNSALFASPVRESWKARYSSSSSSRMRSVTSRKLQTRPTIVPRTVCGLRRQFDGAPVLELEGVEALVLRLVLELPVPGEEGLRVEELVEDERELAWSRRRPPRRSSAMRQISEKRPLKPVMAPSLSRTRIPSAVESSVAVRRERASLNWCSAATCAEASWAEITKPSTVGSSMRSTMLSSNGTDGLPVVAEQPDSDGHRVGGRRPTCRVAQGGHDLPAVGLGHDVGERTHLDELGIMAQQSGDRPRGGFEESGGGHQHDHRADVVHQGPETCLVAAGQFETPTLRQVAQAEEDQVLAGQFERCADDLDEAPPRDGLDADLNGVADVLVLNGGEGAEHQLLVVGVHQGQARNADPVGQRPSEQALRGRVAPGDVAVLVDDDDAVGQLQHGAGQGGHVLPSTVPAPAGGGAADRRTGDSSPRRRLSARDPVVVPASFRARSRLYCRTYPPDRVVAIWLHRQEDAPLHATTGRVLQPPEPPGRPERRPSMRTNRSDSASTSVALSMASRP